MKWTFSLTDAQRGVLLQVARSPGAKTRPRQVQAWLSLRDMGLIEWIYSPVLMLGGWHLTEAGQKCAEAILRGEPESVAS